jgi:hypothetical protein
MMMFFGELLAQTKVAVPTTTVHFADMKVPKKQRIANKKLNKIKTRKVKEIQQLIKQNTDLNEERLSTYKLVFQTMDSSELNQLCGEIDQLSQMKEVGNFDERYSTPMLNQEHMGTLEQQLPDPLEGALDQYPLDSVNVDQLSKSEKDSIIKKYKDQLPDNGLLPKYDSYQSLEYDSAFTDQLPADSIVAQRIESKLESLVKERINNEDFVGLDQQMQDPSTQVQQYVPDLEKYDYQKPEIPEEKLSEALLEQQKERKKQELLDQLAQNSAEEQKGSSNTLSRFSIGGYMRYDASKKAIELTPVITYAPVRKINVGVGYQTNISLNGSDSLNTRGIRTFVQYTFYNNYFLHGESEWIRQNSGSEGGTSIKERNTYIGLGRNFKYRFINTSITALYNLTAPSQLQQKKFTIRLGITISK